MIAPPDAGLARPDEGIWQVDTETSTYVYDVDARLITRSFGGAGGFDGKQVPRVDLRRDDEQVPVINATRPVVGRPWLLLLDVRGDGVITVRITTIVRHVMRLA